MGSRKKCKRNEVTVSSPLLTEEKNSNKRSRQLTETLTSSPPLPVLPFDLIPEILCRLPVKLLMQIRCMCKWWNLLITDSKFAKKHLRFSTTRLVNSLTYSSDPLHKYVLKSYPVDCVFTDVTTNVITQLQYPSNPYINHNVYFVGSCNGIILCLAKYHTTGFATFQLWNPSIRKFKELPPLETLQNLYHFLIMYGFGYDVVTNNYKVVVVLKLRYSGGKSVNTPEVKVHTLGTSSWKTIQKFPFSFAALQPSGIFVSGRINWLVHKECQHCVASLDLGNESYQEDLLPDFGQVYGYPFQLGVLRSCLCTVFGHDVWVMKEHGNKESWTKLFTISLLPTSYSNIEVVDIFEDDQVLLKCRGEYYIRTWIIYNLKQGTFKLTQLKNNLEVCLESLISPCS